jgi:hypothetical protein
MERMTVRGYNFDEPTRQRLVKAVEKYKTDSNSRSGLNEFIMYIQEPYIETTEEQLDKIKALEAEIARLRKGAKP